jgi:hypothetical protein
VVEQVKAACGNDIPVLIYKFNNKQSRVCIPMYAINPHYLVIMTSRR